MKTGLQNQHLQGRVIFLLFITLITVNIVKAQQRVITEPAKVSLVEGDSIDLLCRVGTPISYCRIVIPGTENALILSPSITKPGFKYFGTGLENGQCGVSIERVSGRMHGPVKCYQAYDADELVGTIDLIVALPPNEPAIELISQSQHGTFEAGQPFRAKCVVRDGRPAANISWFLDDEPIYEGLGRQEIFDTPTKNTTFSTTTQEIQRYLTPEDNGKFLICRADHITDRGEPKERRLQLLVSYRPQPQSDIRVYGVTLDRTAIINVTILANPRPTVQWTVDGNVIPQGTQLDRYEAYEPLDLGSGAYNVSLSIAGLTLEDTIKDYNLRASNQYGSQDYTVRISSSNTPVSEGLEIGAIVGIIIAVIVLLAIVLLIVFARVTGRWCFAAKSPKSPTSETSRTDNIQSGANSALLQDLNNVNIVSNNKNNNKRNSRNLTKTDYTSSKPDTVYNPTTVPANDVLYYTPIPTKSSNTNGNSLNTGDGDSGVGINDTNSDLLTRGNELGIPESRCSKWIPKDQRELLEKQARILVNSGSKSTEIY